MEAKVAKTLMEAYASVYDQPEQIDEGITSVVNSPQDKTKGPGPTYKGPRIKMGPGEGGKRPKKDGPMKAPLLIRHQLKMAKKALAWKLSVALCPPLPKKIRVMYLPCALCTCNYFGAGQATSVLAQ